MPKYIWHGLSHDPIEPKACLSINTVQCTYFNPDCYVNPDKKNQKDIQSGRSTLAPYPDGPTHDEEVHAPHGNDSRSEASKGRPILSVPTLAYLVNMQLWLTKEVGQSQASEHYLEAS